MTQKIVSLSSLEQKEWDTKYPEGYNTAPEGWRKIDEKYLAQRTKFGSYSPSHIDYKQIAEKDADGRVVKFTSVHLFYYWDGTGIGIEIDYWGYKHERVETGKGKKKKVEVIDVPVPHVQYYAFGCEHSYVDYEVPAGHRSGIHKAKCTKCGHKWEYDTSD